jgi:hypothetical protein
LANGWQSNIPPLQEVPDFLIEVEEPFDYNFYEGKQWDGQQWVEAPPQPTQYRVDTTIAEYKGLIAEQDKNALRKIEKAATTEGPQQNEDLYNFWNILADMATIDLASPFAITGTQLIVAAGILTQAQADAVLQGVADPGAPNG